MEKEKYRKHQKNKMNQKIYYLRPQNLFLIQSTRKVNEKKKSYIKLGFGNNMIYHGFMKSFLLCKALSFFF